MVHAGASRDVDHVITTAEIGKIFLDRGIKLNELPESEFDCLVGEGTGGAVLFGTTGGVMEAALRTVYEQVSVELFAGTAVTGEHCHFSVHLQDSYAGLQNSRVCS